MSNVGALAANFHKGSRSEYLAQYVFASFGTAISVPHQEDAGVDLYCTMTERIGARAWPKHHYAVQVKSTMSPWSFDSRELKPEHVYEGVDLLARRVDEMLRKTES